MRRSSGEPVYTFLGLDPGLGRTGYAVAQVSARTHEITKVLCVGVIETEPQKLKQVRKTSDHLRRARSQADALRSIVITHNVTMVAMEMSTTTPYTYPTFSFGVMTGIAASLGVPIVEVLPNEVKFAAAGNKRATKADVIAWAIKKAGERKVGWPTSSRPNRLGIRLGGEFVTLAAEHPADALAAIQAAIGTEQFKLAASLKS